MKYNRGFTPTLTFVKSLFENVHLVFYKKITKIYSFFERREQSSPHKSWCRGFTVAEIVVVIAIVSILASVVIFNAVSGSKRSRDVDRQADLRTLQSAIELYKQKYGRYPERCTPANPGLAGSWSGQSGTNFACVPGEQYIMGHVDVDDYDRDGNITERFTFSPEFIPSLPKDGRLPDVNSGYVYAVNTKGTVYKLAARRTVEADTSISYTHPFKNCDADGTSKTTSILNSPTFYRTAPICNTIFSLSGTSNNTSPSQCQDGNPVFETSYAVWGGYANAPNDGQADGLADLTEDIICL